MKYTEAVALRRSVKKVLLEIPQNSQENTCAGVSILMKLQVFRPLKETPTQVLSRGFCKIVMNIFIYRTPLVAASEYNQKCSLSI